MNLFGLVAYAQEGGQTSTQAGGIGAIVSAFVDCSVLFYAYKTTEEA